MKKEGEKIKIEPLRVSIPKKSWENVDFRILGEDESVPKESQKKLKDVALVQAPESEDVSLGPRDTLTAVYRIPSTALPLPGILVQAEMKAGKDTIQSDPYPSRTPPDWDKGILLRKAEIQLKLKSYAEAKLEAEGLIGRFPDEPAGYWIKGQGLQAEGLDAEALNMYNTALEKSLGEKRRPALRTPASDPHQNPGAGGESLAVPKNTKRSWMDGAGILGCSPSHPQKRHNLSRPARGRR